MEEKRHAGAHASFLLPDPVTAAARCSSLPSPAPLWRGRPWSARATPAATAWWGRTTRPDSRRRRTHAKAGGRGRRRTRARGRVREGRSGSGGSSSSPSATARCRWLPARRSARSGDRWPGSQGHGEGRPDPSPARERRRGGAAAEAGAAASDPAAEAEAVARDYGVCGRGEFFW